MHLSTHYVVTLALTPTIDRLNRTSTSTITDRMTMTTTTTTQPRRSATATPLPATKRTMRPRRCHWNPLSLAATALCFTVLSTMTTTTVLVAALDSPVPDFALSLKFLGNSVLKCRPTDSELIRAAAEDCLRLSVSTCGLGVSLAGIASTECDGTGAILRGAYLVTTGASFPPSTAQVQECVGGLFSMHRCLGFFEIPYPFVDSVAVDFDVPMPTAAPSQSPSVSQSPTRGPTQSPTPSPTVSPTTASPTRSPTAAPTRAPIVPAPTRSPTFAPTNVPNAPTRPPTTLAPTASTTGTTADREIANGITQDAGGANNGNNNGDGNNGDSNNVAAIAGSVVGAALLVGLVALFAVNRQKQKVWRDGAIREAITLDEDDLEAAATTTGGGGGGLVTKDSLYQAPDASDNGSSLFGRMLGAAFPFHAARSVNNESSVAPSQYDGKSDMQSDFEGMRTVEPKIVVTPVSILKSSKTRGVPFTPEKDVNTTQDTIPFTSTPEAAPNGTSPQPQDPPSIGELTPENLGSAEQSYSLMGRLASAMHPFHCLAPVRSNGGLFGARVDDQMSQASSVPYEPDASWDPDDNTMSDNEAIDVFMTTDSLPSSDNKRLLAQSVTSKSFKMQRLRTPAEPEPVRPKFYL